MTPEEKKQLNDLLAWKKSLENASSIPLPIDQAFRKRFISGLESAVILSAKGATSENQDVNEGGVATYSVLGTPNAFLQITINNTIYYIPVFT